jgi:hypothetical protein
LIFTFLFLLNQNLLLNSTLNFSLNNLFHLNHLFIIDFNYYLSNYSMNFLYFLSILILFRFKYFANSNSNLIFSFFLINHLISNLIPNPNFLVSLSFSLINNILYPIYLYQILNLFLKKDDFIITKNYSFTNHFNFIPITIFIIIFHSKQKKPIFHFTYLNYSLFNLNLFYSFNLTQNSFFLFSESKKKKINFFFYFSLFSFLN